MQPPDIPDQLGTHLTLRTRWSDEDNQDVLNNAVYMTLFEEARHGYFSALGLLQDGKFPFLLLQTNIRFVHPGRGGQDVRVEVGTTHLGRSSIQQAYRVKDTDGTLWCEGEAVLVVVDAESGSSRPMDSHFREAVEAHEGLA
jgi:acyl-CoA thioester hydrolase